MQIISTSSNSISTKAIFFPEAKNRNRILKKFNNIQIENLKKFLSDQNTNPVDAYIGQNKYEQLTAKIFCPYRLKNFKENYKQFLLIETDFHFINRIAQKCNKYKEQLL